MPTNRTRKTRSRVIGAGGLSEPAYEYFAFGDFFDGEEWMKERTPEEIDNFWKAHRTEILQRYSEENRRKGPGWEGRRPDFFWKELTEPRLHVDLTLRDDELYDTMKVRHDGLEADFAYLKRLNLLEPWEKEMMR
ncbi:MAG: hypothetical protein NTW71_12995 [Deltaproteobacteria bacterium]|nr:hypothetical protein [Deltaproteobacteria bacterium]